MVWNDIGECRITQLNGNLLLRHHSCGGGQVVSMLGGHRSIETARTVIAREGVPLQLVPSYSLGAIPEALWQKASLQLLADRDNDDYVIDTVVVGEMAGGLLKRRRKRRDGFARAYRPTDCVLDTTCAADVKAILRCVEAWFAHARLSKYDPPEEELRGLNHLLWLAIHGEFDGLLGFGVRVDGELVACSIVEAHGCDTASGVVFKASRELSGSAEYLRSSSAARLSAMGYTRLNIQQDLGYAGLREMKTSYRPVAMLRKWIIADGWEE